MNSLVKTLQVPTVRVYAELDMDIRPITKTALVVGDILTAWGRLASTSIVDTHPIMGRVGWCYWVVVAAVTDKSAGWDGGLGAGDSWSRG